MGREIRKVPANWEHPKNIHGHYQPMYDCTYREAVISHFKDELLWHLWPPKNWRYIKEWFECWPDRDYHRPRLDVEPTHFQIYENVTEGTPASPVFESLGEMKEWLLEQGYSEKAASTFTESGYAPSFVFSSEKGVSGMGIHSLDF